MLVSIFSLKKHLKKSNRYSLAVSPDGPKQWGASPPEGQWHLSIKLPPIRALGAAIYSADIKEGAKLQEPFPQTPGEILSRAVLARAGPLRPSDQSRPCQSWGSERNGRPPSSLLPFPSPPSFSSVRGTGYHKNIVQTREKITFADQSVTENVQEQTGEETVTEAPLFFSRWPNAGKEWSLVQHSPLSSAPHPNLPIYVFVEPPALKPLPVQKQTGVGQHTHTHTFLSTESKEIRAQWTPQPSQIHKYYCK